MGMKEVYRSLTLIFIYILLVVLFKVTSAGPIAEKDQALSQIQDPLNAESEQYRYYPELNMYYNPAESMYIYSDKGGWVSQQSLPVEYQEINLQELRYEMIEEFAAEENLYLPLSQF